MSFRVRLTRQALEDLLRLEDFLIEQALVFGDADLPAPALRAIHLQLRLLLTNPYTCRKPSRNPMERELVIPFGSSGYVALFEITGPDEVVVSALRHQREDDYH